MKALLQRFIQLGLMAVVCTVIVIGALYLLGAYLLR
jgi:hypothetical protein